MKKYTVLWNDGNENKVTFFRNVLGIVELPELCIKHFGNDASVLLIIEGWPDTMFIIHDDRANIVLNRKELIIDGGAYLI